MQLQLDVAVKQPVNLQVKLFLFWIIHLSINDKYQSPRSSEDHLVVEGGVEEIHLAWKVPDLEVDEGAAGDVVFVDLVGAFQEQGLIGRHFVENHLKWELGSSLSRINTEDLSLWFGMFRGLIQT